MTTRWINPYRSAIAGIALGAALLLAAALGGAPAQAEEPNGIVVYQSDFGLEDGAVAAMRGVARSVERDLILEDLTHQIPPFDIWAAAYRLHTAVPYWPPGTVFVSVVDPGVGTDRRSVALRTNSGHYIVSPDNGTLTLVADTLGIDVIREIDEAANRLPGSEESLTFLGRDVYSYTAARLAAGEIAFEEVGPEVLPAEVVRIPYQPPGFLDNTVSGGIPILDVRYGNVWTDIDRATFEALGAALGDELAVRIEKDGEEVFAGRVPCAAMFGDVPAGAPLLHPNGAGDVALAINRGDFAATYGVASGPGWRIEVSR